MNDNWSHYPSIFDTFGDINNYSFDSHHHRHFLSCSVSVCESVISDPDDSHTNNAFNHGLNPLQMISIQLAPILALKKNCRFPQLFNDGSRAKTPTFLSFPKTNQKSDKYAKDDILVVRNVTENHCQFNDETWYITNKQVLMQVIVRWKYCFIIKAFQV